MECLKMISVKHGEVVHKVPCGKCAFCLTNKRSQWIFRVHHEIKNQENPGYFLTLTYDEKHVPRVADGRLSLRFYDIQLFIKRIRKARYYAKYICIGEYGTATQRPHYHMLLWTDAPVVFLERNWKSSIDNTRMGSIHFGQVTIQSAMYTLKYILQPKQTFKAEYYKPEENRIEHPRAQFSNGIGLSYLTTAVYYYHTWDYEEPILFSIIDGKKVALPRYYKNKIFTKHQMRKQCSITKWQSIREKRKKMRELIAQGIKNTSKHLLAIRTEQSARILQNVKYNQNL